MSSSGRWVKLRYRFPFSFITERRFYFSNTNGNGNSGLGHTYKTWYEDRRSKLTASTFSAALGFHKGRRMELWLEKIGLMDPFKGSPATCWNNQHENLALSRYHLITGNNITFTEFQVYNKCDWLAASPDGLIGGPEGSRSGSHGGVLEIKCPYYDGNASETIPWSSIPANYMPQAQGLMEILDRDWMDFYAWTPRGSSLFRVVRSPRYWELVMSALSDFWWDHVVPAKRIRESDPNINISHWRPDSKHKLFDVIFTQSVLLAEDSRLLVREINGRMIS